MKYFQTTISTPCQTQESLWKMSTLQIMLDFLFKVDDSIKETGKIQLLLFLVEVRWLVKVGHPVFFIIIIILKMCTLTLYGLGCFFPEMSGSSHPNAVLLLCSRLDWLLSYHLIIAIPADQWCLILQQRVFIEFWGQQELTPPRGGILQLWVAMILPFQFSSWTGS